MLGAHLQGVPHARTTPTQTGRVHAPSQYLDHKGRYLSVRGPLHIARPVQDWPVIVQAGSSEPGRQLAQRLGGYAGLSFVGTPHSIADQMQQWLEEEGSDGFNIMFPWLPDGLDDFVDKVVPELQGRGIFRREYEGTTLRENLGLPRPANRFFSS